MENLESESKKLKLRVGDSTFKVRVSESNEESIIGLSTTERLPKQEGFVMKFDGTSIIPISMKGMQFPIDIIFSLNGQVTKVVTAKPESKDIVINKPSDLIIEVNAGEATGIKAKDFVSFVGEKNDDGTVTIAEGGLDIIGGRQVLDEDGKNQMNLKGGERIFSRISTKRMFELAKAKEYKKLGRYAIKEIINQDKRPAQYAKN